MGMLFKKPKYTPPPGIEESRQATAERQAAADAAEKKQLREMAARRSAMKRDPRSLLGTTGLLGVQDESEVPTQMFVRSPTDKGARY
jgi:hypothetical protein|tara:strand:- start:587 stop:847 length:261 start_codon:yes stop_codon:yes gene_type:complete